MKGIIVVVALSLVTTCAVAVWAHASVRPESSMEELAAAEAVGAGWDIGGWWDRNKKDIQEAAKCFLAGAGLGYAAVTLIGGPLGLIGAAVGAVLCL